MRPDNDSMETGMVLAASCVALGAQAVLILGESGFGKSDLALRLIHQGARLVADDQVVLARKGKQLLACAPAALKGLLEIRGLGIVECKPVANKPVKLVVNLVNHPEVERLPEPRYCDMLGVHLPQLIMFAREASAVAKIHMALHALENNTLAVGAFRL